LSFRATQPSIQSVYEIAPNNHAAPARLSRPNNTYKKTGNINSRANVIAFGTDHIPEVRLGFSVLTITDTTIFTMASLFTRIIRGEIPGHFVYKDEICVAFLTINPIATGHTLVVPIEEIDEWVDLPTATASHLMLVAKKIGLAQKQHYGCSRVGMIIAGFEIPHCHLHVIPANTMADLSFEHAAAHVDPERLSEQAEQLASVLKTI
jgi:histidine triad (HIT) family protein